MLTHKQNLDILKELTDTQLKEFEFPCNLLNGDRILVKVYAFSNSQAFFFMNKRIMQAQTGRFPGMVLPK